MYDYLATGGTAEHGAAYTKEGDMRCKTCKAAGITWWSFRLTIQSFRFGGVILCQPGDGNVRRDSKVQLRLYGGGRGEAQYAMAMNIVITAYPADARQRIGIGCHCEGRFFWKKLREKRK